MNIKYVTMIYQKILKNDIYYLELKDEYNNIKSAELAAKLREYRLYEARNKSIVVLEENLAHCFLKNCWDWSALEAAKEKNCDIPYVFKVNFNINGGPRVVINSDNTCTQELVANRQLNLFPFSIPNIGYSEESYLYQYTALYDSLIDQAFVPIRQFAFSPDKIKELAKGIDFYKVYTEYLAQYWRDNYKSYQEHLATSYFKCIEFQTEEKSLTTKGALLSRSAAYGSENVSVHFLGLVIGEDRPSYSHTYVSPTSVKSAIYSYNILVIKHNMDGRIILYIPGNSSPLHEFNNESAMNLWFMKVINNEDKKKALISHFSTRDIQIYKPFAEEKTAPILGRPFSKMENIFDRLTRSIKTYSINTIPEDIVSNRDIAKRKVLKWINSVNKILLPLAIIFPNVIINYLLMTSTITELGIIIDDSRYNKLGWEGRLEFGILNALPFVNEAKSLVKNTLAISGRVFSTASKAIKAAEKAEIKDYTHLLEDFDYNDNIEDYKVEDYNNENSKAYEGHYLPSDDLSLIASTQGKSLIEINGQQFLLDNVKDTVRKYYSFTYINGKLETGKFEGYVFLNKYNIWEKINIQGGGGGSSRLSTKESSEMGKVFVHVDGQDYLMDKVKEGIESIYTFDIVDGNIVNINFKDFVIYDKKLKKWKIMEEGGEEMSIYKEASAIDLKVITLDNKKYLLGTETDVKRSLFSFQEINGKINNLEYEGEVILDKSTKSWKRIPGSKGETLSVRPIPDKKLDTASAAGGRLLTGKDVIPDEGAVKAEPSSSELSAGESTIEEETGVDYTLNEKLFKKQSLWHVDYITNSKGEIRKISVFYNNKVKMYKYAGSEFSENYLAKTVDDEWVELYDKLPVIKLSDAKHYVENYETPIIEQENGGYKVWYKNNFCEVEFRLDSNNMDKKIWFLKNNRYRLAYTTDKEWVELSGESTYPSATKSVSYGLFEIPTIKNIEPLDLPICYVAVERADFSLEKLIKALKRPTEGISGSEKPIIYVYGGKEFINKITGEAAKAELGAEVKNAKGFLTDSLENIEGYYSAREYDLVSLFIRLKLGSLKKGIFLKDNNHLSDYILSRKLSVDDSGILVRASYEAGRLKFTPDVFALNPASGKPQKLFEAFSEKIKSLLLLPMTSAEINDIFDSSVKLVSENHKKYESYILKEKKYLESHYGLKLSEKVENCYKQLSLATDQEALGNIKKNLETKTIKIKNINNEVRRARYDLIEKRWKYASKEFSSNYLVKTSGGLWAEVYDTVPVYDTAKWSSAKRMNPFFKLTYRDLYMNNLKTPIIKSRQGVFLVLSNNEVQSVTNKNNVWYLFKKESPLAYTTDKEWVEISKDFISPLNNKLLTDELLSKYPMLNFKEIKTLEYPVIYVVVEGADLELTKLKEMLDNAIIGENKPTIYVYGQESFLKSAKALESAYVRDAKEIIEPTDSKIIDSFHKAGKHDWVSLYIRLKLGATEKGIFPKNYPNLLGGSFSKTLGVDDSGILLGISYKNGYPQYTSDVFAANPEFGMPKNLFTLYRASFGRLTTADNNFINSILIESPNHQKYLHYYILHKIPASNEPLGISDKLEAYYRQLLMV
ncbi:hypothetical protein Zmor_027112 [Zophobas morio]|jgi:hypothetical protein|uniref:Dermonecrotic toxin N-terminal domain-containing protein n=1 Tax=Zophobas morio TaxID=2755281 RepID=A0AA38HNI3_9CUCU|nr:hypothetical protein Zmor_027112 [Zophobas morio]